MSSTARGRDRENLDFYPTPDWAIDLILDRINEDRSLSTLRHFQEPAAGNGAIVKRLLRRGILPSQIDAVELDRGRAEQVKALGVNVVCADYLTLPSAPAYDLILTNCAFPLAEPYARKMISELKPGGLAGLLMPLNWIGPQKHASFHRQHQADLFGLPKRPSFMAAMSCSAKKTGCVYKETLQIDATRPKACPLCGAKTVCTTSDSIEYAWFIWGLGGGRWEILPMPER